MTTQQPPSKKRKVLTLEQRVDVLSQFDKGQSCRSIASKLDVGKTQIQSIISNRDSIMVQWKDGSRGAARKYLTAKRSAYTDLNNLVWEWFYMARSKQIPVSGKLLQEKALMLSVEMGHDNFTASNGWLGSFKKTYNIKTSALSGEAASVSEEAVTDWTHRLPALCDGYSPSDVFNADETGLFFRSVPERSLVKKGESCKGGKKSKNRITVLLACSATGEKLKPVVIGHSSNPRCFRGLDRHCIPATYFANKKAWMTGDIFRQWLHQLNNSMVHQGRHILMFVDNCSAHPDVQLSHVKLTFLPPNTTSRLQPCDAGIIRAVKANYRKRLLRHLLLKMDEAHSVTDLVKEVTLLDAILWMRNAWDATSSTTIQKCFANCGFNTGLSTPPADTTEEDDTTDLNPAMADMTWDEYVDADVNVATSNTTDDKWEQNLIAVARGDQPQDTDQDTDDDDATDDETALAPTVVSHRTALDYLTALQTYALHHGDSDLADNFSKAKDRVERRRMLLVPTMRQRTMSDFFTKE